MIRNNLFGPSMSLALASGGLFSRGDVVPSGGFSSRGDVAPSGNLSQPYGSTYRGLFSDWFNSRNIAREDWIRSEQSADNDLQRQLAYMRESNTFNSSEAQKQRDFEERLANTSYQRAVDDMKKAGINPILLYANHSSSTPQGSAAYNTASASSFRHSGKGVSADTDEFISLISSIASIGAGLYQAGLSSKTALSVAAMRGSYR